MTASDGLLDLDEDAGVIAGGEPDDAAGVRRLTPTVVLVIVGIVFAAVQLALFDEGRFLEWDEAVYSSRASDRFGPIPWSAHRADGVAWLVSPLFAVTSSLTLFRVWLVACSSVALVVGFSTWLRPVGFGAPLGLAFFCANWMTLFYGSEASPNLYVAACAVAAMGLLARSRASLTPQVIALVGVVVAVAVVFRPSDGFVLAAVVSGIALVIHDRRDALRVTAAAAGGVAIGFLPWLLDSYASFGGPLQRWRVASGLVESGPGWQVDDHLRLIDGPLIGPDRDTGFPVILAVVFIAPTALAWIGAIARRERRFVLPVCASLLLALPYLVYVGALAPRFLLPALAVGAAGAGASGIALARHSSWFGAFVALALVGCLGASIVKASHLEDRQTDQRSEAEQIGQDIQTLTGGAECHVLAQYGYPQIVVSSQCTGSRLDVNAAACQLSALRLPNGVVFLAFVGELPGGLDGAVIGSPVPGPKSWTIAEVEPSSANCGS